MADVTDTPEIDGYDRTARNNPFAGIDPDSARAKVAAAFGRSPLAEQQKIVESKPEAHDFVLTGVNQFGEVKDNPIPLRGVRFGDRTDHLLNVVSTAIGNM